MMVVVGDEREREESNRVIPYDDDTLVLYSLWVMHTCVDATKWVLFDKLCRGRVCVINKKHDSVRMV